MALDLCGWGPRLIRQEFQRDSSRAAARTMAGSNLSVCRTKGSCAASRVSRRRPLPLSASGGCARLGLSTNGIELPDEEPLTQGFGRRCQRERRVLSPDRRVRREEPPRPLWRAHGGGGLQDGEATPPGRSFWDNSISRASVDRRALRGRGDPGFAAGRGCPPQRSEGDEQTQSAAYPVFCTICSLRSIRRSAPARPCSVKANIREEAMDEGRATWPCLNSRGERGGRRRARTRRPDDRRARLPDCTGEVDAAQP